MSAVWLIVGLVVGAAVTALVMRERIRALRENQAQMADSFRTLSAEALDSSVKQLSDLNRTQIEAERLQAQARLEVSEARARTELEVRRQAVEEMVKPLRQQLEKLNDERARSSAALTAQIRSLTEAQEKLRSETGALAGALRQPNARGQWGEMQLRKVVEIAGMTEHCDFDMQVSVDAAGRPRRLDLVVHLPGDREVVVDAKTIEGVLEAYSEADDDARRARLKEQARALRAHVAALSGKAYWSGLTLAPDFVVLFLPGEYLWGAILEVDPELAEEAMRRRVLITTPMTLLALLHAVAYGWQQERIAASAQAVSDLGRELHGRLARLSDLLGALGARLNGTVKAYNEAVGSYEARVMPGARQLAEHGAVTAGAELSSPEQITRSAREVRPQAAA